MLDFFGSIFLHISSFFTKRLSCQKSKDLPYIIQRENKNVLSLDGGVYLGEQQFSGTYLFTFVADNAYRSTIII